MHCLAMLAALAQTAPAATPPARAWLEEAHKQIRDFSPRQRIYALQRLATLARTSLIAPDMALPWLREAFQAADAVAEPERRQRLRYQMIRDLAPSNPTLAMDLAMDMGAPTASEQLDWRIASATAVLLTWARSQPGEAVKALERIYGAGLHDLNAAGYLLQMLHRTHPDLALQIFERSLTVYQGAPQKDISLMIEVILQCQAMIERHREASLKALRMVLDDVDSLAKSASGEAAAAIGPRVLALDLLRKFHPEEAAKLAARDPETAEMLKELPVGATEMPAQGPQDPAPGVDQPEYEATEAPRQSPEEQRLVTQALRGLQGGDKEWTAERVEELAAQAQSLLSRAQLRTALAITALFTADAAPDKTAAAYRRGLDAAGELFEAEPKLMAAELRASTNLYAQLIAALASKDEPRALNHARELPAADVRFEVLLHASRALAASPQRE